MAEQIETEEAKPDYTGLVEGEPAPAKVEEAPEATGETEKVTETAPESQPGTPDKALQKVQQDLSNVSRTVEALMQKVESGKTLTPVEQKQLETSQRKLDVLRQSVEAKKFDLFDNGMDLAESVLETDASVQGLQQQLDAQANVIDTLQEVMTFDRLGVKYPGVDVRGVWETAKKDSESYARFGDDAWQHRADELFHGRCAAAVKSVAAKKEVAKTPKTPSPTPITPGGAKVSVETGSPSPKAAVTEDEQTLAAYMKLVE